MTNRTRTMAAAAVAVLALPGCTEPQVPTPGPTPTASTTHTPTPSPTPALSAEQQAAATAVVRFYEVADQIGTHPEVDLNSLYEVSGGDLAQEYLADLQMMRVRGWRQTGLTEVEITGVTGAPEPFTVQACVDTSSIDVTDEAGKSLVSPEGAKRVLYDFTVVTLGSPALRVTTAEVVRTPC